MSGEQLFDKYWGKIARVENYDAKAYGIVCGYNTNTDMLIVALESPHPESWHQPLYPDRLFSNRDNECG